MEVDYIENLFPESLSFDMEDGFDENDDDRSSTDSEDSTENQAPLQNEWTGIFGTGQKLFQGCGISQEESTRLIYAFILKNKLSKSGISELLQLINLHLRPIASVPATQYFLEKKLIKGNVSEPKKYFYCPSCSDSVDADQQICQNCKATFSKQQLLKSQNFFLLYDLKSIITNLLKIPEVAEDLHANLQKRNSREGIFDSIREITDGQMYQKLRLGEYDITCCINTDGVNIFKSSSLSMWPILISINELSYHIRRKYTLLAAMWSGYSKPEFNTFLKPFVDQCNTLSNTGLVWKYDDKDVTSKIRFPMFAADAPARCALQGLKQYNGTFSCPSCLTSGENFQLPKRGHKMIFPPSDDTPRTHELFLEHLQILAKMLKNDTGKDCYGVQDATKLILLKDIDIVKCFVTDIMHTAYLGVLKALTNMFFNSRNHKKKFYINAAKAAEVDAKLLAVKVPFECNRQTRSTKHMPHWKANEWKTWMMVCVPILHGILPLKYVRNLSRFVKSMSLLSADNITEKDIKNAEELYQKFYKDASRLYGKQVCTFNMHVLKHAADCVRAWGPLWAYSMFQFENSNGVLTRLVKGTRRVCMQIVRKVSILQELQSAGGRDSNVPAAQLYLQMMENKRFYKDSYKCGKTVTLVGAKKDHNLSENESQILQKGNITLQNISTVWSFKTFFVNNVKFTCSKSDSKKLCNSIVTIHNQPYVVRKVFLISVIDKSEQTAVVLVNKIIKKKDVTLDSALTFTIDKIDKTLTAFRCSSIQSQKYVSMWNDEGKLTNLSKLINTAELE